LLGEHTISLILDGRWATVGALLAAFPPHATTDPELAPVLVSEQLRTASLEEAAACLDLGERRARAAPADRRRVIDVRLAMLRLWLADQRGDFGSVVDEVRTLLAPIAADAPADVELGDDLRAVALLHLGIVELWSHARPLGDKVIASKDIRGSL
jgi:LuxR family maltose regulon positive regulatory protein